VIFGESEGKEEKNLPATNWTANANTRRFK
jgi:hypothetical protein